MFVRITKKRTLEQKLVVWSLEDPYILDISKINAQEASPNGSKEWFPSKSDSDLEKNFIGFSDFA